MELGKHGANCCRRDVFGAVYVSLLDLFPLIASLSSLLCFFPLALSYVPLRASSLTCIESSPVGNLTCSRLPDTRYLTVLYPSPNADRARLDPCMPSIRSQTRRAWLAYASSHSRVGARGATRTSEFDVSRSARRIGWLSLWRSRLRSLLVTRCLVQSPKSVCSCVACSVPTLTLTLTLVTSMTEHPFR